MKQLAILLLVLALAGCAGSGDAGGAASPTEIIVSAAASLSDVSGEVAKLYESRHPRVRVLANFGGSGALEQQIRQGAEVDVFISAGVKQMDALESSGLLRPGTRRVVAGNELVLVVPAARADGVRAFADLAGAGAGRIAMGAPASVPAGAYAEASLRAQGLWDRVLPKVVYTGDVRQALAYVERGEVDAALVYRTDALRSQRVRVAAVAPAGSHAPIVYPAAVIAASSHPADAERYLDFLAGPEAQAVFRRYGFAPVPADSAG